MEQGVINLIERVGSLGLLGWLLVWATGTAWPKVSAHLDTVSAKLDKIADQLTGLREDIADLHGLTQKISGGDGTSPSLSLRLICRSCTAAATGGSR